MTPPFQMSQGEIAAATPIASDCSAGCQLIAFERNAYRDRCHALERTLAYLLGREPELAALNREVDAVAQRDAVIAALGRLACRSCQ
jgi:hypothetical protein